MEFLRKVAKDLLEKHPNDLEHISVLLPSKRSGLFLNKYLHEEIGKAFLAPKIITWNDFLEKNTSYTILDDLALTFKLYEAYKEVNNNAEEFEVFNRWAATILSDFNEIDNYLLKPNEVYKNLRDIKELEEWSFLADELSEMQQSFSEFWEILRKLYHQFNQNLSKQNFAYSGKIKRFLLDKKDDWLNDLGYTYWIGFYALSPSEQKIIDTFLEAKKGFVYWDADDYYYDKKSNLAGDFFRKFVTEKSKKKYKWVENNINQAKVVVLHEVPGHVFQCTIANELVAAFPSDETALILADENLLIPMLENLDKEIEDFNISMRVPLDKSPLLKLVNDLIDLHESARKSELAYGKYRFYYKNLVTILSNTILEKDENKAGVYGLIKDKGRSLFTVSEVKDILEELGIGKVNSIFDPVKILPNDILDRISSLIDHLKDKVNNNDWDNFHSEMLYRSNHFFERLMNYCRTYPFITTANSLKKIINTLAREEQLDFFGEPLKGLQVLGMLESRAIDMKRVVLVGCNEGVIPKVNARPSFLPFDLKMFYKLPTHKEYESIFAYYFYRLFQQSEEIHLIYNTKENPLEAGEKSRFITQLQFESSFGRFIPEIRIKTYPSQEMKSFQENISIQKDEKIIVHLKEKTFKKLSPSAINTYLSCPLDFYYKYVLQLAEEVELEEKVQASTLGSIVHLMLEYAYKPHVGKNVLVNDDVEFMIKDIEFYYNRAIKELKLERIMRTSYNKLAKSAILEMLRRFLKIELEFVNDQQLFIKALETRDLYSELNFETHKIGLSGIVDRIDSTEQEVRMIDYKSGIVGSNDLKIKQVSTEELKKKQRASQLLFYYYLYKRKNPKIEVHPYIYSLVNLKEGAIPLQIGNSEKIEDLHLDQFEEVLGEITNEMLNKDIPFRHNEDAKYCTYCKVKKAF